MKVNGKDDIPYITENKHVWNHQPGDMVNLVKKPHLSLSEAWVYRYIIIVFQTTNQFIIGLTGTIMIRQCLVNGTVTMAVNPTLPCGNLLHSY